LALFFSGFRQHKAYGAVLKQRQENAFVTFEGMTACWNDIGFSRFFIFNSVFELSESFDFYRAFNKLYQAFRRI
jgi:hypothetical protein